MNGMNELLTVKRYWDSHLRRDGAALVFCVFNNQDLNQVTWEQRVLSGDPRNPDTQQIPDFPYAGYAELLGFKGIRCEDAESLADLWREALATDDRPVVLEVVTTREYPPLPPHITFTQAHEMTKALLKGDEDGMGIMENSLRGKLAEFKESLRP
jgi:pyruvate dehydrogenase (quinone)